MEVFGFLMFRVGNRPYRPTGAYELAYIGLCLICLNIVDQGFFISLLVKKIRLQAIKKSFRSINPAYLSKYK
jgi:hypothetical protein